MRRHLALTALVLAAACSSNPPAEPPPAPMIDSAAIRRQAAEDSARAARERAEAERLAREEAERRARAAAEALRAELAAVINFDYDRAEVRPMDMANLDRKAAIMNANAALTLRVGGHADERGSDEYNLALGNRRAAAAKRYLVSRGVAEGRISVVSYGEERPLNPASTEAAWAQNRRAEFEVTAGGDNLTVPR